MANPTTAEVGEARAVATGAVSWAVLGTTLPTTAVAALNAAFKGLGYIGSDGIQPAREVSVNDVTDMNGDIVAALQESFSRTYQFELLQADNEDVKNLIFGDANVTKTAGSGGTTTRIVTVDKGVSAAKGCIVVDTYRVGETGATRIHREVAAIAQPVEVEYGPYVANSVRSYTVTVRIYRDSSGNYVNEYDDDGVVVP